MKKPILAVLAAGMGSRYGGLKQMDPVGPNGEFIIDYSIFDAHRAGFDTVVFIIKHEIEDAFRETVGERVASYMEVRYAFQQVDMLPEGYSVPEGRMKPWGTGHAVLCAAEALDAPFVVINADDYYGPEAFQAAYDYLTSTEDDADLCHYAMVGYQLKNTVTENGSVARGVCATDAEGRLVEVVENTMIETYPGGIHTSFDGGATWADLDPDTLVSMNLWCFRPSFVEELIREFPAFLDKAIPENPMKCEYFLPLTVTNMIRDGKADFKVLSSHDKWYGVTYHEDRPTVVAALKKKTEEGLYPSPLAF